MQTTTARHRPDDVRRSERLATLTLDPGARPLRTQPHVSAGAALWRETKSAIGSATAAGSVVTEK
jgi:hypothetical protein